MTNPGMAVFADTGYWIALMDPEDPLNQKALQAEEDYKLQPIITSEWVLAELLNGVARRGQLRRRQALLTISEILNAQNVVVVPASTRSFWSAVELYEQYLGQRWSLIDCTSFVIMKDLGIQDALAHDRDFAAAGFRPLLRDG